MTLDDACLYLGISPDSEDLDLDELERSYNLKAAIYDPSKFYPTTPEFERAKKRREQLDEAYNFMLDVYVELYESDPEPETPVSKRQRDYSGLLKLAGYTVMVVMISFAVFMFFMRRDSEPRDDSNYERVLQELEALKSRTISQSNVTDYADLVERVMPAMVRITTDRNAGSGFFVSPRGEILTNYHVIDGARMIRVTMNDGESLNASLKDADARRDMALLAVRVGGATPFLRISSEMPRQGEAVIAIGNPRGLDGTVSNGIISAFRVMGNNSWVQFTAPVSPGSSGGALVNLNGEVVGMPAMLLEDGQNLNFAIAPNVLARFLARAR